MHNEIIYETVRGPMTRQQIADATGLTPQAVAYRIAHGIDLFAPRYTSLRDGVDTPKGRMTVKEIAAMVGVTDTAIYHRIKRWPDNPEKWIAPKGRYSINPERRTAKGTKKPGTRTKKPDGLADAGLL